MSLPGEGTSGSRQARVRMVAEPSSVPAARHFVGDALAGWGQDRLIDDVSLCVTELSTNATLHSGSRFFEIELEDAAQGVRVAVLDAGRGLAESMRVQSELADALREDAGPDDPAATGRGISIVSMLATVWGIDELPDGTRVWAEFGDAGPGDAEGPRVSEQRGPDHGHVPVRDGEGDAAGMSAEEPHPADPVVVEFNGCPAATLIAHDDNIGDFIRELQLIGGDLTRREFARLATLMAGQVARHAVNWDAARIQAIRAVRAGQDLVDVHVLAPPTVMGDVAFLRHLMVEAERLSEEGRLITMPAAAPVQRLRDWMESEFGRQVERGLKPISFADFVTGQAQPRI